MNAIFQKNRIFTSQGGSGGTPPIVVPLILTGGLLYAVPDGQMLEHIEVKETGGTNISLRFGLTAGTDNIAPDQIVNAAIAGIAEYTGITLNKPPVTGGYNVFVSKTGGGAFTPSVLTFYLLLRKVY